MNCDQSHNYGLLEPPTSPFQFSCWPCYLGHDAFRNRMRSMASKRNQSLDVLRCIAVLMVLGNHFPYYGLWGRAGWAGVDLFFVLSGFLISGLLYKDYTAHGFINWEKFLI